MRVALVVHRWPGAQAGGTGLYVTALAAALAAAGHRVAVVAPRATTAPGDDPPGVVRWPLAGDTPTRFADGWSRPVMLSNWVRFQRTWRPEVVHIHHLSGLPMGLPAVARSGGARVVFTLHDYALVCARGQLIDAELNPCSGPAPSRCASCLGHHVHLNPVTAAAGRILQAAPRVGVRARQGLGRFARPGRRAMHRVTRRLDGAREALEAADVLLSPSHDLADRMAAQGWRRPGVFPLPLVRPIDPAPEPRSGPLRFLFASSMIPTKGPDRLLAAFARLPADTAMLTLAGPSPAYDGQPGFSRDLRAEVARTPGATWRGHVPPAGVPDLLAAHDVLVLPSIWPENSPLVIREATAAGLRTVASSLGGSSELDPLMRVVDPADGLDRLTEALAAEITHGRGRRPPLSWPTPGDHAEALVTGPYSAG
ncbi:MAG: glycosyltransferase [Myxococcota bacterium]|nr:glycosyltransferase [Myxococcota bacterium]